MKLKTGIPEGTRPGTRVLVHRDCIIPKSLAMLDDWFPATFVGESPFDNGEWEIERNGPNTRRYVEDGEVAIRPDDFQFHPLSDLAIEGR